jgi:hypothetical protein
MRLPQVGDLVRLIDIDVVADVPYEDLLGIALGYETKGAMAGRTRVVWFSTGSPAADGEILCYLTSRLQVVE